MATLFFSLIQRIQSTLFSFILLSHFLTLITCVAEIDLYLIALEQARQFLDANGT
jgi:hypothetical protein